jgi:hypothetical protein
LGPKGKAGCAGALWGVSLTLLKPALAWATNTAGVGPWEDTTLNLIQTDLSGPAAHALVTSAFAGSGVLYATGGGHGPASATWQRLVWVARQRWVRCR